jgi:TonB family protein
MADTKALFTQLLDAARTALTEGDELSAAESLHSAIVAARSDPSLRRELASALFHLGKLSRKFGRAGEAEAGPLLTEALTISEGLFGREHAALAPVLTELSRLHLQQSQHAPAADALKRLLAIARVKGEEHPDVATALSGLAFVKRKLGDNASAEALYRDALRIREKALEPNHMVTVVTLEQLSETCAARGNLAEALVLLHRALPTREATLGAGHKTVRAVRSRLAELELQVAITADTAAAAARTAGDAIPPPASPADTPSTAAPSPTNSMKLEFLGEPEPRALRPAPTSRERAKAPTVAAAVAAASLMASSIQTSSAPQIVISPPESARPSGSITGRESGAAYRDAVLPDVAHGNVASGDAALGHGESSIALVHADSPERAPKKRTVLYASAGVTAAAIAIAGLLMSRPRAGGGSDPVSTAMSAPQHATAAGAPVVTAATRTVSTATGAVTLEGAPRADSFRSASATRAPAAPVVQPEQRAPESAPPEFRAPRVEVHLGPINIPSMPAATSVDSIVRPATERLRASDTDRTGTGDGVSLPTSADVDNARTPAKIIGRAPEPRFPDALLRSGQREGEVVVRFMVDELGRVDVESMIVERSNHELFTAAVRDILPRFRFEPARTHAPESKPVAAWVTVPFRFATKK